MRLVAFDRLPKSLLGKAVALLLIVLPMGREPLFAAEPTLHSPVGKMVVTNIEGSATISTSDTLQNMQERGVYDVAGTVIETRANEDPDATDEGFITVVLSNGVAFYLEPGTRIEIREFTQGAFNPSRTDMDLEPSISSTRVFLNRGLLAISTSEMLPGSSLVLETPHGTINIRGRQAVVQIDATSTRVAMFEGGSTIQPGANAGSGTSSRPLQAGEEILIQADSAGQAPGMTVSSIPQNQATPFSDRIAMASIARRMVYFETVTSTVGPASIGLPSVGSATRQATAQNQGSPYVSAFSQPTQQIVPVIVVPVNLPVQFTVSPSRLR